MNKYIIIIDEKTRLVRIAKKLAKTIYNHNLPVMFCPVNINPLNVHGIAGHWTRKNAEDPFDNFTSRVNAFEYYNCNRETGYYTAFYIPYCYINSFTGKREKWSSYNCILSYDTEYIKSWENGRG